MSVDVWILSLFTCVKENIHFPLLPISVKFLDCYGYKWLQFGIIITLNYNSERESIYTDIYWLIVYALYMYLNQNAVKAYTEP